MMRFVGHTTCTHTHSPSFCDSSIISKKTLNSLAGEDNKCCGRATYFKRYRGQMIKSVCVLAVPVESFICSCFNKRFCGAEQWSKTISAWSFFLPTFMHNHTHTHRHRGCALWGVKVVLSCYRVHGYNTSLGRIPHLSLCVYVCVCLCAQAWKCPCMCLNYTLIIALT